MKYNETKCNQFLCFFHFKLELWHVDFLKTENQICRSRSEPRCETGEAVCQQSVKARSANVVLDRGDAVWILTSWLPVFIRHLGFGPRRLTDGSPFVGWSHSSFLPNNGCSSIRGSRLSGKFSKTLTVTQSINIALLRFSLMLMS